LKQLYFSKVTFIWVYLLGIYSLQNFIFIKKKKGKPFKKNLKLGKSSPSIIIFCYYSFSSGFFSAFFEVPFLAAFLDPLLLQPGIFNRPKLFFL